MHEMTVKPWPPSDPLPEDLVDVVESFKGYKEYFVAKELGSGDIPPVLRIGREGREICRIYCGTVNRDEGLDAARYAVPAFAADDLAVAFDSHMADDRWRDAKGRLPDPGELQHACDNEGACDLGLITDCIALLRVRRGSDDVALINLPYHVNKAAKAVHWQPHQVAMGERAVFSGIVPDGLREAMSHPTLHDAIARLADEEGLSYDEFVATKDPKLAGASRAEVQFHEDMGAVGALCSLGFAVAYRTETPEQHEAVRQAMKNAGFDVDQDGKAQLHRETGDLLKDLAADVERIKRQKRHDQIHMSEKYEAARRRRERGE